MPTPAQRKNWFERNEQAEKFEADGYDDEALALYEANADEDCDLVFTYERMAAIYRRKERYDDELRVLERALFLERRRGPTSQTVRLQRRIETAHTVRERHRVQRREGHGRSGVEPMLRDRTADQRKGCLSRLALLVVTLTATALYVTLYVVVEVLGPRFL